MNNTTSLSVFDFNDAPVRVHLSEDGQPWFVAADVCRVLEIANHHQAINGRPGRDNEIGLDDDERDVASVTTPGGVQKMSVISESGLYALIFKSRKSEAKSFRKWVTKEVLPSIRRTGGYGLSNTEEVKIDRVIDLIESILQQRSAGKIDNGMATTMATVASQYLKAWDVKLRLRSRPLEDGKETAK